jgi:peptidyl-prolyl cis-trans isomerase SurA
VREREVYQRIRITDGESTAGRPAARLAAQATPQLNIAQILVTVPDRRQPTPRPSARARADQAVARVRSGRGLRHRGPRSSRKTATAKGGEIGLRRPIALPDLFVDAVRPLASGRGRTGRWCAAGRAFTCSSCWNGAKAPRCG